jgi:hypothetical protein
MGDVCEWQERYTSSPDQDGKHLTGTQVSCRFGLAYSGGLTLGVSTSRYKQSSDTLLESRCGLRQSLFLPPAPPIGQPAAFALQRWHSDESFKGFCWPQQSASPEAGWVMGVAATIVPAPSQPASPHQAFADLPGDRVRMRHLKGSTLRCIITWCTGYVSLVVGPRPGRV